MQSGTTSHLPCFAIWCRQRSRHRRNTVRTQKLRWFRACLHASIQKIDRRIADIQANCTHTWRIHSQRKLAIGSGWWVHRECVVCEKARSEQVEQPVCPTCGGDIADSVALTARAMETARTAAASRAYRYSNVWMFYCPACDSLHTFAVQDETKKPPSG